VKKLVFAAATCALLSGCLGYHIGPAKPYYLRDVHSIAVPTFGNSTTIPRIEALVTDTVIKQFQQDGTFRIASNENADAILKGEITRISRSPARSVRGNVLATSEFNLVMRIRYKLVGRDGQAVGPAGEVTGSTSFFVNNTSATTTATTGDVVSDERQALPLAAEELASHLVTQLSEGW
jgi:outer membrane lipopolysaccharide assembly protein LptE/RlpB